MNTLSSLFDPVVHHRRGKDPHLARSICSYARIDQSINQSIYLSILSDGSLQATQCAIRLAPSAWVGSRKALFYSPWMNWLTSRNEYDFVKELSLGWVDLCVEVGWVDTGQILLFCGIQKMVRTQVCCLIVVPKTVFVTLILANSMT